MEDIRSVSSHIVRKKWLGMFTKNTVFDFCCCFLLTLSIDTECLDVGTSLLTGKTMPLEQISTGFTALNSPIYR